MALRVTRQYANVGVQTGGNARVYRQYVEVLHELITEINADAESTALFTQEATVGREKDQTATSPWSITQSAQGVTLRPTAVSSVAFTQSAQGVILRQFPASAINFISQALGVTLNANAASTIPFVSQAVGVNLTSSASSSVLFTQVAGVEKISTIQLAENTIGFTQEARQLVKQVAASSAVAFAQQADAVLQSLTVDAENTIAFAQLAVQIAKNVDAENALGFTQSSTAVRIQPQAFTTVTFTQTAIATGPIEVDAQNTILFGQGAFNAEEKELSAESTALFTQTAQAFGPKIGDAENTINFISEVDTTVKARFPSNTITFAQTLDVVKTKIAKSTINFTQAVTRELRATGVSQLFNLSQSAVAIPSAKNTILFTQQADFVPPPPTRFAVSELVFVQTLGLFGDRSVTAANTISFKQALGYFSTGGIADRVLCTYSPFVGDSTDPDAPSPPASSLAAPDDPGFTKGLKLECPANVDEVTLTRSMNLGDRDQWVVNRIQRLTRGRELIVYADPDWPKYNQLSFSVSAVRNADAMAVLNFIINNIGCEITITSHEGRQWTGIITNPDEAVVQDRDESYTISIEFQGEEV